VKRDINGRLNGGLNQGEKTCGGGMLKKGKERWGGELALVRKDKD